ncbi:hypothetical protein LXL04_019851 [Taraxacum kok-saghyz]
MLITDRILTRVHVCVVTELEGSIPGDTAATTSSQLRRSNRASGKAYTLLESGIHIPMLLGIVYAPSYAFGNLLHPLYVSPCEYAPLYALEMIGTPSHAFGSVLLPSYAFGVNVSTTPARGAVPWTPPEAAALEPPQYAIIQTNSNKCVLRTILKGGAVVPTWEI